MIIYKVECELGKIILFTHKMLNVNCIKNHSIILSITCQGLINFPLLIQPPHIHLWIFKTLWVIIFWVRVTHKMLNVNCISIYPIILSVTCHGWRNFPSLIQIPWHPDVKFSKPYKLLFFELESLVKCWMWIA